MSTTIKTRHVITYDVRNYPMSGNAASITWSCSCSKSGKLADGRIAPTMARAKALAKTHTSVNVKAALK
jgi:hypothetical protein